MTTTTTCTRHPDRETRLHCTRCGRPWCATCLTPAPVGAQCVECVRDGRLAQPPAVRPTDFLPHTAVAALAALCVAGFVAQALRGPSRNPIDAVARRLGASHAAISAGEYHRLVTHLFVHASALHLLVSLVGLWWLGGRIEERAGAPFTILTFFGAGIAAAAAAYVVDPPAAITIGATTALFGWAGVLLATAGDRDDARQAVGALVVGIVAVALVVPSVSYAAHAGGFLAGLVFGAADRATATVRTDPVPRRLLVATIVLLAIVATAFAVIRTG